MAAFDFAPMLRSTIGFDNLPDMLSHALEREASGYPPYNIEKLGPDTYSIVMAVAGFAPDDLEITQAEGRLIVRGAKRDEEEKTYLHRGLARRSFTQAFDLAEHVEVTEAKLEVNRPPVAGAPIGPAIALVLSVPWSNSVNAGPGP